MNVPITCIFTSLEKLKDELNKIYTSIQIVCQMPSLSCVNLIWHNVIFLLKPSYLECFAIRRGAVDADILPNSYFCLFVMCYKTKMASMLVNLTRIVEDLLHL